MTASILFLGLLIGMQHALEADHVAAVAAIASKRRGIGNIVRHGAIWGFGHTVTLMVFAGAAVLLGFTINNALAGALEGMVGVMLIGLGGHVLYRLWRERVHFHLHRHADGTVHVHAHAHRDEVARHDPARHEHEHPERLPIRTLLVGMMHGLAGSAALVVLTSAGMETPSIGFAYVVLFGAGSIVGMALLSAVIAVPLSYTSKVLTWANRWMQGGIGVGTAALGVVICLDSFSF